MVEKQWEGIMDMISQIKLELPIPMFLAPPLGMAIGWKREDGTRGLYIAVAFVSALMGVIFSHNAGHFSSVPLSISQAIVFISLGVSYIREDNKPCPDPAFYLWATMGAGLILGLGLYMVAFFSTAYILLIETLGQRNGNEYRFIEAGRLEINLTKHNPSFEEARERLGEFDIHIKNISLVHNNMGESIFKASILTHSSISISETVDKMISSPFIDSISLLSVE